MAAVNEVFGTIDGGVSRPLRDVYRRFRHFTNNDVLFAKITPSMENGKAAIATRLENGVGFGSTEFHVLRSLGAVLPEYLWRYVRQPAFRNAAQRVMSGAVGQQRVPAAFLRAYPLPLPPLAEQQRIVTKIGLLLGGTARARAALERVPNLLQQYRAQILKLAFSGNLTHDIRTETSQDELSTEGYPASWTVKALGEIGHIQSGIQVGRRRRAQVDLVTTPYLRVANVQRGWIDLEEIKDYRSYTGRTRPSAASEGRYTHE